MELSQPRPRVLLRRSPQPHDGDRHREQMQELVDFAREMRWCSCTTSRTIRSTELPPSIRGRGAREVAVELYSMTKGFLAAARRIAFVLGRADVGAPAA